MEMRYSPRRGRHLAPTVHQSPADEPTRFRLVTVITCQRFKKERHVLPKRVELVLQRPARTEQIAADFTVHLENERRFRLVIGIIGGEKIGEQLSIFVNRINRFAEKSSLATELPDRLAIGTPITPDGECFLAVHPWPFCLYFVQTSR